MLEVSALSAYYGQARALAEVNLRVEQGEVVTLAGRNGAGKTTLLRCVMGLHPAVSGRVRFAGGDVSPLPAHQRARRGLGLVPDDRGIFAGLSVEEHLTLPPVVSASPWTLARVYETFPALEQRRRSPASKLSGGEQQMLALARVLRMGARMLLCDEPTEGLAPIVVSQIADILRAVKDEGGTVLLVEQNLHFARTVADRHYLLSQGRVAAELTNAEMGAREHELLEHLGL
ncbi:ABC transporter ATP-binding protein [Oryzihumus sp.]|uniref:ABC transporter ATP-binding protein n=1 Tax=Oryzihumus sp. TaxID=1968903 RepID=UPI002ED91DB3